MNESEQLKPDDFWKKAFDEASEMPPSRVWDAIERRLDKSEEGIITGPKIVPLWDSGFVSANRFTWLAGIAASLALLLIGWWSLSSGPAHKPVAQHRLTSQPQPQSTGPAPALPAQTPAVAIGETNGRPSDVIAGEPFRNTPTHSRVNQRTVIDTPQEALTVQPMLQSTLEPQATKPLQSLPVTAVSTIDQLTDGPKLPPSETHTVMRQAASVAFTSASTPVADLSQADPIPVITTEQLVGRSLQARNLKPIQRIVWISPTVGVSEEKTAQSIQKPREVWASLSVMPGAFDPSVSVRSVPAISSQAYANAATLNSPAGSSQSTVNSRAGLVIACQAAAGVQLTPRWSIESGVGYLAGCSSVESPGQVTAYSSQAVSTINRAETAGNLYINALRNSLPTTYKSPAADIGGYQSLVSYDVQSPQTVANNYRFVQVPVQIGYQLRPRKRFGLAVLGGLLTNIFVRNTVGDNVVINAKDGVYRPLSWSATLGARFRYRPSRRWSASLAGLYQTAFGSGTEATSPVQNRLSATGMSFGVDYHF